MSREVWTGEILKAASDLTLGWVRPKYRKMNGPCDPTAFDSYAARLDYHVNILRFACDELTDFRLEWHANYYTNRPLGSGQQFSIGIYEAMEKISDLPQPPWYAGGFGVIGHEPDFQYWATMNTWALDEATALSLDFEPTGKVLSDLELPKPALQVAAFYARRRKVLENNLYLMAGTNIPAITPTPLEFCQWTIKADLEIPTGLLQAVSHTSGVPLSRRNLPSPTATNDPALDPRERTNLLLLVSLMAQKAYGFDPARERSDVANQIQSDLDRMGISLHVQTIRKYLKAAASILPKGAGDE